MDRRHPFMKLIALTVVFTFLVTNLTISPASAAAPPASERPSLSAETLSIPAELGQITDLVKGNSSAPAFIHIQSAHGNYQAEKNIEAILTYLKKNSSVRSVLLEGAVNRLQPELFRIFPGNPDFNRKVTDKLIQEGYLTGPESFLIESTGTETQGWGIENLAAYKKDRNAFIRVIQKEKTAEKFLDSLRAAIDQRFASKLNKEFSTFVRQSEAFNSESLSFENWLKVLSDACKKHLRQDLSDAFYQDRYPFLIRFLHLQTIGSRIDRDKARLEAQSFLNELAGLRISKELIENFERILQLSETDLLKTGARTTDGYSTLRRAFDLAFDKLPKDFPADRWPAWILYAQYIILMQELDGKGLQEETVRLRDKIQNVLAKTEDEKEYLLKTRSLYLLRRLFGLELTRPEYEELKQIRFPVGIRKIQTLYDAAITFYSAAVEREKIMFQNAARRMAEQKENRAVIVTGGFHADGLKKLITAQGGSYVQITPRIEEISKRDHEISEIPQIEPFIEKRL